MTAMSIFARLVRFLGEICCSLSWRFSISVIRDETASVTKAWRLRASVIRVVIPVIVS